jgi:predicted Co/Zn/Cd cation transporter (cation efflux family)
MVVFHHMLAYIPPMVLAAVQAHHGLAVIPLGTVCASVVKSLQQKTNICN